MNQVDLSVLVKQPDTNTISGRTLGEQFSVTTKLLEHINRNEKIVIVIDEAKVRAINDSFIKGYFSKAFEVLKTKDRIKELIEIKANRYYVNLFEKNWSILEAINK